ncbi:MAG: amidohydrolase, partial [Chlorobiaceae bacterium]|nr:amidohydrolase [Chlorobiaceae bacterium]
VMHVAEGLGVEASLEIMNGYPVLYNDPSVTERAALICSEYLGEENVLECEPIMTAEDFSYYLQACPGTFWQIGTGGADQKKDNTLHSPVFNPDEKALLAGSGLLAFTAIRLLGMQ